MATDRRMEKVDHKSNKHWQGHFFNILLALKILKLQLETFSKALNNFTF
jgi:hypothetical protein